MTPQEAMVWFNNARDLARNKNNKSILQQTIKATSFLSNEATIPQRLWHIIHSTETIPGCKICNTLVAWDRRYKQYKTYCGNPKCPNTDPDITARKIQHTDYAASVKKRQATNMKRYGHTNFLATETSRIANETFRIQNKAWLTDPERLTNIATKRMSTIAQRYGVDNFSTKQIAHALPFLQDKTWLYAQHYEQKKTLTEIANQLNIKGGPTTIAHYLHLHSLTTQTPINRSAGERELVDWLSTLGIEIQTNVRNIIQGELDVYLPQYRIAIEYCGLYWHSEQSGKTKNYHKNKYERCKQVNVRLLTMYEDEWKLNQLTVKHKICDILGKNTQPVIFARKCYVVAIVDNKVKKEFYDTNHIQGSGPGSVTYGLYYNTELIATMSLIKQTNGRYVLNRYATSCKVVGGFSKLLTHFQRNHEWLQIISFADLRWSSGDVYYKNGFTLDKTIPPDYCYSPTGHTRIHKFNYRHIHLSKKLKTYDPLCSETENCNNNGILRIWDCGKLRFVINNSQ